MTSRLREHKPSDFGGLGRNNPSFIAPGAEAFKRDLPDGEIHLLDADIASVFLAFLAKHSV